MKVVVDWDRRKAQTNLAKHQVSFNEAKTVFRDHLALTEHDVEHSDEEDRLITIGVSSAGRLLTVIHTEAYVAPDTVVVRIISSRKATSSEHRRYEQQEG